MLNVLREGATGRVNESNNNKPNQNHSGAAMQTVAGVEASIAINWNQQSNVHWHSHAQCRRQTYLWQAWLVSARVILRKDGSNCPAKYTSWPCLAPSSIGSSGSSAAAMAPPQHPRSIPTAPRTTEWLSFVAIPIAAPGGHVHPTTLYNS